MIAEGIACSRRSCPRHRPGRTNCRPPSPPSTPRADALADTDWRQIVALYDVLVRISADPMVRLNSAVAVAMLRGPAAGLELLDDLAADPKIANHHRLAAVRAHLLEQSGDLAAARQAYADAAKRTTSARNSATSATAPPSCPDFVQLGSGFVWRTSRTCSAARRMLSLM